MRRPIEVTFPLSIEASITFEVDDASEVTPKLIEEKIIAAQRELDRRGEDDCTGIYMIIQDTAGEPKFYDPNAERTAA